MHRTFNNIGIKEYDPSEFYKINKKVYDFETKIYKDKKIIPALSLISVMLVDLGIIYED